MRLNDCEAMVALGAGSFAVARLVAVMQHSCDW
jgi:hypothetical protein